MPKAIAIHWSDAQLAYAVAEDGYVEAMGSTPLEPDLDAKAIGARLTDALAPYSPSRAKVIVAPSRESLEWQHHSLPPCPADELPDLVRIQADRDIGNGEDIGFDYLSLTGDESTAQQILTVSIDAKLISVIREVCGAANLTLGRIVPLGGGWPAITRNVASASRAGTQVYVAPEANKATVWATRSDRVVLFRQFPLVPADQLDSRSTAMVNDFRRTLLSLSQHPDGSDPNVTLVGRELDSFTGLANLLNEQLGISVDFHDVSTDQPSFSTSDSATLPLPLGGLAIDESQSIAPLVDLLHPHRRPQTEINVRTYSLAAVAGALLLALLAWTGYARLQSPLHQAAVDRAELDLLNESLEPLQDYELRAAAIRDWRSEAPNVLLHLQQLSKSFRPEPLDAQKYPTDQDVLLEKLDLNKRQLTIDALARNSQAVQPLESRLRESDYRPQRGKSDPSETVKEYSWHFKSTIEITSASDPVTSPPEQEPKS